MNNINKKKSVYFLSVYPLLTQVFLFKAVFSSICTNKHVGLCFGVWVGGWFWFWFGWLVWFVFPKECNVDPSVLKKTARKTWELNSLHEN